MGEGYCPSFTLSYFSLIFASIGKPSGPTISNSPTKFGPSETIKNNEEV